MREIEKGIGPELRKRRTTSEPGGLPFALEKTWTRMST